MKKANKLRTLLFASLGAISVSLGLLITPKENVLGVDAAKKQIIESENNFIELGMYPQTIIREKDKDFASIYASEHEGDVYTYNNEKYSFILNTEYWTEGGGKYEDETPVEPGITAFFKWEPIKWHILYEDTNQNAMFLFADRILDTRKWQEQVDKTDDNNWVVVGKTERATSWEFSTVRTYLNDDFITNTFDENEKGYLKEFVNKADKNSSNKDLNDKATIISLGTLDEFKRAKSIKGGASDYAKSKKLMYHFHDYNSGAFFWVNNAEKNYESKRISTVRGTDHYGSSEVDVDYAFMGIRPMIALDLSKVSIGTPQTEAQKTAKKNNAKLIIGILFSVLGMVGLIVFLTLWNKGKLSPKMNVKVIIAAVAAFTVVTTVGLISLTSYASGQVGGGGGGCSFKTGYYLQSTAQETGSSGGISFVQVGKSCYRFNSNGTVNYCAAVETNDASDFKADSGNGTWTKSGCTLSVTYNSYYGSNSFKLTISGTKLLYNGTEAYHWVRGE